jgi:hypothetical protein
MKIDFGEGAGVRSNPYARASSSSFPRLLNAALVKHDVFCVASGSYNEPLLNLVQDTGLEPMTFRVSTPTTLPTELILHGLNNRQPWAACQ